MQVTYLLNKPVPNAWFIILVSIAYLVAFYFTYIKPINEFKNRHTQYSFAGETRQKNAWYFLILLFVFNFIITFITRDFMLITLVTFISPFIVLYSITGIILVSDDEIFIDETLINRKEITKINFYTGTKAYPFVDFVINNNRTITKRAPKRVRAFLAEQFNDIIINTIDKL